MLRGDGMGLKLFEKESFKFNLAQRVRPYQPEFAEAVLDNFSTDKPSGDG